MTYRMKNEPEKTSIEGCMSGNGAVWMEKLFAGQKEMVGRRGAYMHHTPNPRVSADIHTREREMETMAIVRGKAVHTINRQDQYLEEGGTIVAQPGDGHGIAQTGDELPVLTVQVLFA